MKSRLDVKVIGNSTIRRIAYEFLFVFRCKYYHNESAYVKHDQR